MKPKYSEFYDFGGAIVDTTLASTPDMWEKYIADKEFDKAHNYQWALCYGDYGDITFPVIYHQEKYNYVKKARDVINPGFIHLLLISDRFKNLLEENGITGWQTYPIELYDRKGNLVEGYNGFTIIGRAGDMLTFDSPPEELGYSPKSKGFYFNVDLWDGTDIFHVRPNFILITSRLAELLIKHKISGISIARLTDYGDWKKGKRIL